MNQANTPGGNWKGVGSALFAAVLFEASTPLAKSFSPRIDPVMMAGLLYLGSGLGLGDYAWLGARLKTAVSREAALSRHDLPWIVSRGMRRN